MDKTSPRSLAWLPLAILGCAVAFMASLAVGWWQPWWACRGTMVLFGFVAVTGTLLRPAWFWNSPKARRGRWLLGERGYSSFLLAAGLLLIYIGFRSEMLDRCNL